MYRQIRMNKWRPGVTEEEVDSVVAALREMAAGIPLLLNVECIKDNDADDDNWDFLLITDFASREDHQRYMVDPNHKDLVADRVRPILESTARIQYEIGDGAA